MLLVGESSDLSVRPSAMKCSQVLGAPTVRVCRDSAFVCGTRVKAFHLLPFVRGTMEGEPSVKVQVPVSRQSSAKRTVLFVDDEPRNLDALRFALQGRELEWDMVFVPNAESAISELRTRAFDVIVSDLAMPGVDGATLLAHVRDVSPSTVRILLANETERDAALRASPVCHQSLTKPCNSEALKVAIERTLGLKGLLENERVRAIVGKIDHLPVLPRVYSELNAAFASPDCSPSQIARIVEGDLSLIHISEPTRPY